MQIVYISNNIDNFRETLPYIRHFMGFITDVVVFVPEHLVSSYIELDCGATVISERDLLNDRQRHDLDRYLEHPALNHCKINYLLRAALPFSHHIEPEYILSDDDYRPLRNIDITYFKNN